jgi:hypothetical protein
MNTVNSRLSVQDLFYVKADTCDLGYRRLSALCCPLRWAGRLVLGGTTEYGQTIICLYSLCLKASEDLNYKIIKLRRFENWILLSSSGKKGGRRRNTYLLGPLVQV